jgi:hypothetical protein
MTHLHTFRNKGQEEVSDDDRGCNNGQYIATWCKRVCVCGYVDIAVEMEKPAAGWRGGGGFLWVLHDVYTLFQVQGLAFCGFCENGRPGVCFCKTPKKTGVFMRR